MTPLDLMAALRDHGAAAGPAWSPVNGALSAPCAHSGGLVTSTQSTASWVADLRAAPLHWVTGTSAPCTSLFKPVRVGEPLDVDPSHLPTNRYDERFRWWRHERLHRLALRDVPGSLARFGLERDRLETAWAEQPPDSAVAFEAADAAEARWLADLASAGLPDRRPRWLRLRAGTADAAAGLPAAPAAA
jgi:hypothetical protein